MSKVTKREITVLGQNFIRTLKGNRIDGKEQHIKVHSDKLTKCILYLDPYDSTFEVRPETIAKAIKFALENDWVPTENNPDVYLSMKDSEFYVLPQGIKFGHDRK